MEEPKTLDCRGLSCPQPVIKTRQALDSLPEGASLLVLLDNEASSTNVQRFAQSQGHTVRIERSGQLYRLLVVKGKGASSSTEEEIVCDVRPKGSWVIYVSSDIMGMGDDELGRRLLVTCLDTLSHFADQVSHVLFVNTGVKLVVEGSEVLESLRQMERMGVKCLACGTCLEHFGLRQRVKVGEVSNMYQILEVLSNASKVFRP